jgi:DNA polymerase IV
VTEERIPIIFHVDMDAFFVSVEELFDPTLKGKPVVVGGDPSHRGVVAAASYTARKFGIHSALPLSQVKALCPEAIFLPGRRSAYSEYSTKVQAIFAEYAPTVEMVSIDEAYLDMTGSERLYGNPFQLAHRLRTTILDRTGLSASIGISRSKLVSKVSSDLAKPAGILHVWPGFEPVLLAPLRIGKIPGIGPVTEQHLSQLGIVTVGDLFRAGKEFLENHLGRWGESLYRKSLGEDTAHFEFHEEPKSISHETTFDQDINNRETLEKTLVWLTQKVCHRLREHRMYTGTVTLKVRDFRFKTITRAACLPEPSCLDRVILEKIQELFHAHWDGKKKIRLLGVALGGLCYTPIQEGLFDQDRKEKLTRLYAAADGVREKFGFRSVISARTVK